MKLTAVVAMASNRVIGNEGDLPWHLPADLKHFKERTGKGTVVMGRRTWESIPAKFRPLPGRKNIVISRSVSELPGAKVISSPAALETLDLEGEVFLIGGGQLYKTLLESCDEICLSYIFEPYKGDTVFPAFEHLYEAPEVTFTTPEFEVRRYQKRSD